MIPDIEIVLTAYLKGRDAMTELGARVVGRTPSSTAKPWVRITQLNAQAVGNSRADHLIAWLLQFDCYAGDGGHGEASALTRIVREQLRLLPSQPAQGAVVTGVQFASCPRQPDIEFEPARERFILTATVWGHA